ncbi:MAG: DegT/DnrJ/EryC1/StrS aminotransferase family protein [Deltaproteobacteria bacterium]|nr:DegT/DnrJ/EryC1/StrS aminotransferase family protein [Deltaproteobacteria bacterium]
MTLLNYQKQRTVKSLSQWPVFEKDEQKAVLRVLASGKVNYWTGAECRAFEKEFAGHIGVDHAIALANGSVALELALKSLHIGPGDEVVVTPRSFIASVSCVVNVGATPVFADVDEDSGNITAETISRVLSRKTRAIIVVHLAGWPCEMDSIMRIAREHRIYVIEDCAQAHGAEYKGRRVGSIGHLGTWSFCQDKIMTTGGEGGMITTNHKKIWSAAWSYKDHGKSYDYVQKALSSQDRQFRWVHGSFGTNYRMIEMQAAIGRIQLKKLEGWHKRRKFNSLSILSAAASCSALRVPTVPQHIEHAWYRCYVYVRPEALKKQWSRERILQEMNQRHVPCYSGICPEIYLEKAFSRCTFRPKQRLKMASILGQTSLMFFVHPTMTDAETSKTCDVLKEVMKQAGR